jgi:hypothetical protein
MTLVAEVLKVLTVGKVADPPPAGDPVGDP